MTFKNAIFDMDGTLIDSMSLWRDIEINLMQEYAGIKFDSELIKKLEILPLRQMLEYVNSEFNICVDIKTAGDATDERMFPNYIDGKIEVKPFVFDYLSLLRSKNIKIALATATPKKLCVPYLEKVGLMQYFDVIVTTKDDVKVGKSRGPDVYDVALKKLGGTKEDTIVFEDVLVAVQTAIKAGYYTIAVEDEMQGDTRPLIKEIANKFITSYKEMMV